jgi:putative membrane protein
MLTFVISILLTSVAVAAVPYVVPGVRVNSFGTAIVVALVYGLLARLLFGLLVLLTLPLTILTLGLFLFVISAFLLWITDQLVPGFEIDGFGKTILAAVVISVISTVLHWIVL